MEGGDPDPVYVADMGVVRQGVAVLAPQPPP